MNETSSDETAQGVGVGVGRRALATVIDTAILFAVSYVIAALTGQTTAGGFNLEGWPFFLALLIYFLYYIGCEGLWSATPGKLAIGLCVVREGGGPIDWRESTIRNLLRFVDGFLFYLVGAILVWMSPKRQRLGDRIAETLVVRRA